MIATRIHSTKLYERNSQILEATKSRGNGLEFFCTLKSTDFSNLRLTGDLIAEYI